MSRREMLVAMLQAFFLSLFPWLRTERGIEVVGKAIESALPANAAIFKGGTMKITMGIKGFELPRSWWKEVQQQVEVEMGKTYDIVVGGR